MDRKRVAQQAKRTTGRVFLKPHLTCEHVTMEEQLQLRVYGEASQPTLIYLPGLHGDWTLIAQFPARDWQSCAVCGNYLPTHAHLGRWATTPPMWNAPSRKKASPADGCSANLSARKLCGRWWRADDLKSKASFSRADLCGIPCAQEFVLQEKHGRGNLPVSADTHHVWSAAKIARFRYRHSPETMANIHTNSSRAEPNWTAKPRCIVCD